MLEGLLYLVCCFLLIFVSFFVSKHQVTAPNSPFWIPFFIVAFIYDGFKSSPTDKAKLEHSSEPTFFAPDTVSNQSKIRRGYEMVGKDDDTDGQNTITEYQEQHTGKWFVKSKLIKVGYTEEDLEELRHREIRKKSKKR
ncbi:MAG: hypothetical protein CMA44_04565 [Euryarchaeota archaeon]|nr:hypothetical protein [Euryarchaeota archaeon]